VVRSARLDFLAALTTKKVALITTKGNRMKMRMGRRMNTLGMLGCLNRTVQALCSIVLIIELCASFIGCLYQNGC
jgi:hypothetical protein